MLLLDAAASVPVVKNADLLVIIRPADDPIRVDGIGGHLLIDEVGDLLDIGTVYFNPNAVANVVSHATLEDVGTVTYDQANSRFTARIQNTYVYRRVFRFPADGAVALAHELPVSSNF